jgi:putative SOS response-associated peptidase YedK
VRDHPEVGDAFTLLTVPPGPDIAPYHNRQVALLDPPHWRAWLDGSARSADLLHPSAAGGLAVAAAA